MKIPRFRLAWLMAFVAIAALNFAAMRALLGFDSVTARLLLVGALPMVNVLAVGILIAQRQPGSRTFLLGFEAFGAMAVVLFIVLATCFPREVVLPYVTPVMVPIESTIGYDRPFVMFPIVGVVAVALLGWPQVAFALAGGSLSRRFKVTITRR